ncbi:hypothetical protein QL285_060815 [Trifolium repens]|nr:hypothetical protein QL285_060815 [Trifolium repens]
MRFSGGGFYCCKENVRIRVRIVRIWKVHAFLNPSESSSIEMVLVDEKINSPEDVYFENLNEDQTGLNTPFESKVVAHDDHDAGFSPKEFEENMTKMRLGVLFPTTHASNILKEILGMGSQHILRNLSIADGNPLSRGSSNLMPMVMDL